MKASVIPKESWYALYKIDLSFQRSVQTKTCMQIENKVLSYEYNKYQGGENGLREGMRPMTIFHL